MYRKIFSIIFMILSLIVFMLLIKYFYFDTNIGFKTEILKLRYSSLPVCVDVIIGIIFMPILIFLGLSDLYDRIYFYLN